MGRKRVGALLRAARQAQGISYYALAEEMGMRGQSLNAIERGVAYPSIEVAARLSSKLMVDPRDLFRAVLEGDPVDM